MATFDWSGPPLPVHHSISYCFSDAKPECLFPIIIRFVHFLVSTEKNAQGECCEVKFWRGQIEDYNLGDSLSGNFKELL